VTDVFIGRAKVSVPDEVCEGLAARLELFGAPDAAARLRKQRSVARADKPVVREVLCRWRQSSDIKQFAEELWKLQVEVGKGLTPRRD
jgi:hypothetical protein